MPQGRPKKNKDEITESQLWDVLKFAQSTYPNIFTPDLVSSRLKDITLNPLAGTEADIDKALKNPKDSTEELIGFGQNFELTDMLYKRHLYYLGNLPSWDYTYTCINIDKPNDYKSNSYKNDEKVLTNFFDKFNHKQEFNKALRQMLRQETYYCVLRDDSDIKYTFQELPNKYCQIDGYWENGVLFSFNAYWLIQPGVSLDMYPNSFKTLYSDIFLKDGKSYNPAAPVDKRTGSYVYWHQLSPETDNAWAFKLTPEIASQVPFFSPMYPDLVLKPLIRKLQKNKFIVEASKIIIGLIGFNKDQKSGSIKDSINLSPETAGKFASLIRQGLSQEISFAMAPFEDVKSIEFKSDNINFLDQYNKVTVGQSGSNMRLLYSLDKMNAEESRSSLAIDEQLVTYIYPWFESFLNYQINKRTKKFKFSIKLQGTNMPSNRQQRLADSMTLAQSGILLPQNIAAAIGKSYIEMKRELEMANADEFTEKLMPLISMYQTSGNDVNNKGGRPREEESNPEKPMNDNTQAGRDAASNISKGKGKI